MKIEYQVWTALGCPTAQDFFLVDPAKWAYGQAHGTSSCVLSCTGHVLRDAYHTHLKCPLPWWPDQFISPWWHLAMFVHNIAVTVIPTQWSWLVARMAFLRYQWSLKCRIDAMRVKSHNIIVISSFWFASTIYKFLSELLLLACSRWWSNLDNCEIGDGCPCIIKSWKVMVKSSMRYLRKPI